MMILHGFVVGHWRRALLLSALGSVLPAQPAVENAELEAQAGALIAYETARQAQRVAEAEAAVARAREHVAAGNFNEALALLAQALRGLPATVLTQSAQALVLQAQSETHLLHASRLLDEGRIAAARRSLDAQARTGVADVRVARLVDRLDALELAPPPPPISEASPGYLDARKEVARLMARGDAQYEAGDLDGAQESFRRVESLAPDQVEAKARLLRIALDREQAGSLNRARSRAQMLEDVAKAWQRPGLFAERPQGDGDAATRTTPLAQKLAEIQIPSISFNQMELSKVAATLSAVSEDHDTTGGAVRGVNVVLLDPAGRNPAVSITLRNLSLKRILDFITDSVGYQYEVQADAVVVRPGGETTTLDTAFFPVSRSTVIRMSGPSLSIPPPPSHGDPFGPAVAAAPAGGSEAQALRSFLQQAGVNFDGTTGSSLAYDGSAMIVTQTARNLDRIRNILNRYNDVRQVEIEAKFIEVQAGALEELGVTWNVVRRGRLMLDPATGTPLLDAAGAPRYAARDAYSSGGVRPLAEAFRNSNSVNAILIDGEAAATTAPPTFPGAVLMGGAGSALANLTSVVGDFDVSAVIRALSQKQGTDLLSAPKVTVLSGNTASMVVAQEMRYPQSYGEIQSQVGSSNSSGSSGSAGVTVTAGTPQDFATRNVGVELRVTPIVEEDDYSISLDLNPKVTEFEGFVEYGGPSLAISSGRTVTVPPGFYQPIFSVREVSTKVTLWDGATLIMGGLTREEVKQVDDRIPVLGSIPGLGRLFRSKGETTQKRNLLIFVTANLVSPGGSPKNQPMRATPPSTQFQNPTWVTPAGSDTRQRAAGDRLSP